MNASTSNRFAAFTIAVVMTAVLQGALLTGFNNIAQDAFIAQQSAPANAVALQKVTVVGHQS